MNLYKVTNCRPGTIEARDDCIVWVQCEDAGTAVMKADEAFSSQPAPVTEISVELVVDMCLTKTVPRNPQLP